MRIMLARQMNLLGWMRAPEESLAHWDDHATLAAAVRADGLSRTLVCGMGGSSLVADVLAATFDVRSLRVLDSTNPDAVRATGQGDLGDTLFVISSKSGNTIETLAFYHYFAPRSPTGSSSSSLRAPARKVAASFQSCRSQTVALWSTRKPLVRTCSRPIRSTSAPNSCGGSTRPWRCANGWGSTRSISRMSRKRNGWHARSWKAVAMQGCSMLRPYPR